MKKIFILSLFVFGLTMTRGMAQSDFRSGYIINQQNDTVWGKVDYRQDSKRYQQCRFKKEDQIAEYSPQQIKGYGFSNDEAYSSVVIDSSFVEILVEGKLSLYRQGPKFYVQKKGEKLQVLERKVETIIKDNKTYQRESDAWKGIMIYLTSDCLKNATNLLTNMHVTERDLTQLVVKYNKCQGTNLTVYKEDKPWTKLVIGAAVGATYTTLKTTYHMDMYSYMKDRYTSIDPTVGVVLDFSSPRIMEKLSLQPEVYFTKSSYTGFVVLNTVASTDYHNTQIDLTTISIPISLKYSLPKREYSGYIQGGFNFDYHIKAATNLRTEKAWLYDTVTTTESKAFDVNKKQGGFWGGIGFLKAFSHFDGSINVRYFHMLKLSQTAGIDMNSDKITFTVIIYSK
ncbi:outer membrane beta-barrel protein [Prolixibacter denitrificans]|uniref:Outer membrane protein with beta-barrel domain n=2 Tax=Prolixibacter denitrificans TaxID=1541063 RepID=A0A2P8C6L4_9BACT|nr:outer membrane beta-barrel protein [Prolixibacter denitrificans]PSK80594.1 outer membrane protein with beta-barrel domain [Prolixibacter denitrificans]